MQQEILPVFELYHPSLDQKLNNRNLQDKVTSSWMSYIMEREHKLYSNHHQTCNKK